MTQTRADTTRKKHLRFLGVDVFPWIGARPIGELTAPDLVQVIKRVEQRGTVGIAWRVHKLCGRIFSHGIVHGLCTRNPARDLELRDLLAPVKVRHHAALTEPRAVGGLLRAIDGFVGQFATRCALRLAPLLFVRPEELRHAEWAEIDLEQAQWRIPGPKMKMREQHLVPLSRQAIAVLQELKPCTGAGRYLFPSERTTGRPMSENTVNAALRRLGYSSDEMTGHGFRSLASTLLHELGYPHAVIERQLAHAERNRVSAAYNYAEYLPERLKMMQAWADHLDTLRAGAVVIPLRGKA